jgi:hypothetical protein
MHRPADFCSLTFQIAAQWPALPRGHSVGTGLIPGLIISSAPHKRGVPKRVPGKPRQVPAATRSCRLYPGVDPERRQCL